MANLSPWPPASTALWLFALAAACGWRTPASEPLAVFAASSLTDVLQGMEQGFEEDNDGIHLQVTFAGSQVLSFQIEQGAPADVFLSADADHMEALVAAGLVRASEVFAHNELVVIVPPNNPAGISSFADLPMAERLVLGTPEVPIGRYTQEVLALAEQRFGPDFRVRVDGHVVSEESNVRLVRAKVELGEADAAIVYRTDAAGTDRVRVVEIPSELNVRVDYHIGLVAGSQHPGPARRWLTHVASEEGRRVLEAHGFVGGR